MGEGHYSNVIQIALNARRVIRDMLQVGNQLVLFLNGGGGRGETKVIHCLVDFAKNGVVFRTLSFVLRPLLLLHS